MRTLLPAAAIALALAACNDDAPFFPYFDASPDASSDASGDTTVDTGPECVEDIDCGEGAVCRSGVCATVCTADAECSGTTPVCDVDAGACVGCLSSDDCADPAPVCDTTAQRCVQCLGDADCGDGTCVDAVCRTGCEDDIDCGDEETCSEGVCEPIETGCEEDEECGEGKVCDGGECVAETICTPGTTTCDASGVSLCNEAGTAWEADARCEEGTECVFIGGLAQCASTTCEPGEMGCLDGNTAFVCEDDGSRRVPIVCEVGQVCVVDSCEAPPECVTIASETIDFGAVLLEETVLRTVRLTNCGTGPATIVRATPVNGAAFYHSGPGVPHTFDTTADVEVGFTAFEPGSYTDELQITMSQGTTFSVNLSGRTATVAECPEATVRCLNERTGFWGIVLDAEVGDLITCDGNSSTGETDIVEFYWELDAPSASGVDAPSDDDTNSWEFVVDAAGTYSITLGVADENGTFSCENDVARIEAEEPVEGVGPEVTVSLTWGPSADLDLHLLRGADALFGSSPGDCHYNNPNPDWGVTGDVNDPALDIDVTDGFGPENISVNGLEDGILYTAVVALSDFHAATTVNGTVQVVVEGETERALTYEWDSLVNPSDQWTAAQFRWTEDGGLEFIE